MPSFIGDDPPFGIFGWFSTRSRHRRERLDQLPGEDGTDALDEARTQVFLYAFWRRGVRRPHRVSPELLAMLLVDNPSARSFDEFPGDG